MNFMNTNIIRAGMTNFIRRSRRHNLGDCINAAKYHDLLKKICVRFSSEYLL